MDNLSTLVRTNIQRCGELKAIVIGWTHDTGQLGDDVLTWTMHLEHEFAGQLRASILNYGEHNDTLEKLTLKPETSPDSDASHVIIQPTLNPPENKQY
jgi:proline racemase